MVATTRHFAALLVIFAACATTPPVDTAAEPSTSVTSARRARNPYVITEEELHDPVIVSMDAARAIRQLRPTFFRQNGPQSFSNSSAGSTQISYDFGPLQPLSQLTTFGTINFVEVRFLDVNEATNRFGINANGGPVILLLTRKSP